MFASLYARVMSWAAHRHAPRYLAALSFAESAFFPVPPDVLLIPLCVARPNKALRLGMLTTAFSTLGGLLGYLLGWLAFDLITPLIRDAGYWAQVLRVEGWFREYGVWIVFVAGFSPLPYKVFTVTAGAMSMPLLPFVFASFIGRGARFMLVAALIARFGPRVEPWIRRWVEWLGWLSVLAVAILLIWLNVRD
ncbi:MAG: VTT domain-containing protein [Acidihalobacter sp.]|jgi:membrane protein YqaA with SNARE-associated domain|uniref:YqaA family protein n=1 Tax=Acidihalobacter sp. TaxID=1872108 RepID=UPI00307ED62D